MRLNGPCRDGLHVGTFSDVGCFHSFIKCDSCGERVNRAKMRKAWKAQLRVVQAEIDAIGGNEMRHDVRLKPDARRALAIRAYELSLQEPKLSREAIGLELNLSTSTARNLVLFGQRIAEGREPE